jgi:hypothetical protein
MSSLATPAGHDRQTRLQRDRLLCKLRPLAAPARQSAAEYLRDGHAQERGGDVGTVVDVLFDRSTRRAATHQPHRIDIQ